MAKQEKPIRILHPNDDGTWVEFHNMSTRQKEALDIFVKTEKALNKNGIIYRINKKQKPNDQ